MSILKSIFTSWGGWSGIVAGVIVLGNAAMPVVPAVWANLIGACLGVLALYFHGSVVNAGRVAGIKGV
jgi:hypothetical protein